MCGVGGRWAGQEWGYRTAAPGVLRACLGLPSVRFWGRLRGLVGRGGGSKWLLWWVGTLRASHGVFWGFSRIAQKFRKRCVGVGRRLESAPFAIFLGSMDPGLSFDVCYSPWDPLGAELEFL